MLGEREVLAVYDVLLHQIDQGHSHLPHVIPHFWLGEDSPPLEDVVEALGRWQKYSQAAQFHQDVKVVLVAETVQVPHHIGTSPRSHLHQSDLSLNLLTNITTFSAYSGSCLP
jgi:hypothetical protein